MTPTENIDRRTVLQTLGAGVAGGTGFVGTAAASPRNSFGYVAADSKLLGKVVTLSGSPRREKVFCDAGGSESRIKTEVWELIGTDEELYLIPGGYETGDTVTVGSVILECTRNDDIKGEVTITKG